MKKKQSKELSNPDRSPVDSGSQPMSAPLPAYEHKLVKHGAIRSDPDQPRKVFAEGALKELADSIQQKGIVQPIGLELVPAKYRLLEPDLHRKDWVVDERIDAGWDLRVEDTEDECRRFLQECGPDALVETFRIIWGERRWRAAGMIELPEVPANVYPPLTPEQRFALQFIENNQRENLSALEEAAALQKQLEERRRGDLAFSPEKLAAELGMSRAGMYERLKLNRLHAPVRDALLAGKISTSVAGVVAIVPLPNQQEKLLAQITNENDWKFPYSVRDVQEIVESDYVKQLKDAPFDIEKEHFFANEDPKYLRMEPAFVGSCQLCRHRTGNLVEQFPELKNRPNACTRPDCFGIRCKVHWAGAATEAAQKGKTVLTMAEFNRVKTQYVAGDLAVSAQNLNYGDTMEKAMGKYKPEPVLVATANGLQKFYPREDAIAAAKKNGTKFYDRQEKLETAEAKAKREAKEKQEQEQGVRLEAFMETQWPVLGKALPKIKADTAWEIASMLVERMDGYSQDEALKGLGKPSTPAAKVLSHLFADSQHVPVCGYGTKSWNDNDDVFEAWKLAGIDLKAEFEAAEKEAQKTLALPAKGKLEQTKLLDTKPNKKKRGGGRVKRN